MNYYEEAMLVIAEQFGHDVIVSLATVADNKANIRTVNAYFKDGAFYITTYLLSCKMQEILGNPSVAICHNLFVAHGAGENLGNPLDDKNRALRSELQQVFCAFYEKHVAENDPNTCFLKVKLDNALVFTDNAKFIVDFDKRTAEKQDFVNDIVIA